MYHPNSTKALFIPALMIQPFVTCIYLVKLTFADYRPTISANEFGHP